MAFQCDPQTDGEGNVVGFSTTAKTEGFGRFSQDDYIETDQGVKHVFQDVELQDEDSPEGYSQESYDNSLLELHPELPTAMGWAAENLSPGFCESFNEAMQGDDLTEKGRFIDMLLQEFNEASEEVYEEQTEDNPFDDVSDEEINEGVSELLDAEPLGYEVAQEFSEAANQWLSNGYEVEAAILELTNQFHQGSIDASEAISTIIETYGDEAVLRAYQNLNN